MLSLPLLSNCQTEDKRQGFSPTIYVGDSKSESIRRAQSDESISCKDVKFNEMFCMFDRDLEKLFARCLEQKESEKAWYHFGKKKAGNIKVKKPKEVSSDRD